MINANRFSNGRKIQFFIFLNYLPWFQIVRYLIHVLRDQRNEHESIHPLRNSCLFFIIILNWTLRRQNGFLPGQPSRKLSKWKQGLFKTKFIIIWETEFSTGAGWAALFRCPYLRKTRISKSAPAEIISTLLRPSRNANSIRTYSQFSPAYVTKRKWQS